MSNGFDIHVSEDEFKSKPPIEQAWLTFKAIESVTICVQDIHERGCSFSKERRAGERKLGRREALIIFGSSIGVGIPIGIAIYTMMCR